MRRRLPVPLPVRPRLALLQPPERQGRPTPTRPPHLDPPQEHQPPPPVRRRARPGRKAALGAQATKHAAESRTPNRSRTPTRSLEGGTFHHDAQPARTPARRAMAHAGRARLPHLPAPCRRGMDRPGHPRRRRRGQRWRCRACPADFSIPAVRWPVLDGPDCPSCRTEVTCWAALAPDALGDLWTCEHGHEFVLTPEDGSSCPRTPHDPHDRVGGVRQRRWPVRGRPHDRPRPTLGYETNPDACRTAHAAGHPACKPTCAPSTPPASPTPRMDLRTALPHLRRVRQTVGPHRLRHRPDRRRAPRRQPPPAPDPGRHRRRGRRPAYRAGAGSPRRCARRAESALGGGRTGARRRRHLARVRRRVAACHRWDACTVLTLRADDFGAATRRTRVFLIATRDGAPDRPALPGPVGLPPVVPGPSCPTLPSRFPLPSALDCKLSLSSNSLSRSRSLASLFAVAFPLFPLSHPFPLSSIPSPRSTPSRPLPPSLPCPVPSPQLDLCLPFPCVCVCVMMVRAGDAAALALSLAVTKTAPRGAVDAATATTDPT